MSYGKEPTNIKLRGEIKAMKILSKFLGWLGLLNHNEIATKINDIEDTMKSLISDIDNASECLGKQGWANISSLNIDVAKNAIELYQSGDIEAGDSLLSNEIEKMLPSFKMRMFNKNFAFSKRKHLILLAIKDHEEHRYHASIPVLLSCADGIVSDITSEQKGLFAEGDHIEIPNSIIGHKGGLPTVIKLISQTRRKTNLDNLKVPYRNGIIHGHDINYYNNLVSTKTLSLLFAVYDWAIDENKSKEETKQSRTADHKGLWQSIIGYTETHKRLEDQRKNIDSRKPRDNEYLNGIILNKEFNIEAPEYAVIEQFNNLKSKRYGKIVDSLGVSFRNKKSVNSLAGELKNKLDKINFIDCIILSIKDEAPALSEIEYIIRYEKDGKTYEEKIKQRLINEDKDGNPLPCNMNGGNWKMVFDISNLLMYIN